jgi:hypothetical protein
VILNRDDGGRVLLLRVFDKWVVSLEVSFVKLSSKAQRKGKGGIYKSHTSKRVAPAKFRTLDYAEKHGYLLGVDLL